MVEPTHLKNVRQIGSFPQGSGWKYKKYLKPPPDKKVHSLQPQKPWKLTTPYSPTPSLVGEATSNFLGATEITGVKHTFPPVLTKLWGIFPTFSPFVAKKVWENSTDVNLRCWKHTFGPKLHERWCFLFTNKIQDFFQLFFKHVCGLHFFAFAVLGPAFSLCSKIDKEEIHQLLLTARSSKMGPLGSLLLKGLPKISSTRVPTSCKTKKKLQLPF